MALGSCSTAASCSRLVDENGLASSTGGRRRASTWQLQLSHWAVRASTDEQRTGYARSGYRPNSSAEEPRCAGADRGPRVNRAVTASGSRVRGGRRLRPLPPGPAGSARGSVYGYRGRAVTPRLTTLASWHLGAAPQLCGCFLQRTMVKYDRHFFLSGSKRRFRSQALTDLPSSRSSALAPGARLRDEASSWRARCGGSTAIEQYERRAAVAAAARRGCTRRRSTDMSVLKASPRWSNALTSAALGRPRAPPTASLWPRAAGAQLSGPGSSPEQAGEPLTRWVAAWAAERAAPPCTSSPKQLPTRDVQKSARHAHESSRCMACSRAASRAIGHSAAGSSPSRPVGTRSEKRPQSSTSSKGSASSWLG